MQTVTSRDTFTTTHLRFTVRVVTPLALDEHSGASLRGNFFNAIWHRFCQNHEAPSCAACSLHTLCPVSALAAPLREDNHWGHDLPRPYLIDPPEGGARLYQPGEHFSFGITLIGSIIQYLPYLILSIAQQEQEGLGQRLPENRGQRGRYKVERIESYHPFCGQSQAIYAEGRAMVDVPALSITREECEERARHLNPEQITLRFLTHTRLVDGERLVKRASFRPLFQRLLERYLALERAYGNQQHLLSDDERRALVQQAETIQCISDQTMWNELSSYSNRQKRSTPLSGLLGTATFRGDLQPYLKYLVLGELVHIGKNIVKGCGKYHIVEGTSDNV
jgi:hypothetical protein